VLVATNDLKSLTEENKTLKRKVKVLQRELDKILQNPIVQNERDKKELRREKRRVRREEKRKLQEELALAAMGDVEKVEQIQANSCPKCQAVDFSSIILNLRDGKKKTIRSCKKCQYRETTES
jgi:DNA-directed RNA polymerase subunit M/transcription elongation factor TFIIS